MRKNEDNVLIVVDFAKDFLTPIFDTQDVHCHF